MEVTVDSSILAELSKVAVRHSCRPISSSAGRTTSSLSKAIAKASKCSIANAKKTAAILPRNWR